MMIQVVQIVIQVIKNWLIICLITKDDIEVTILENVSIKNVSYEKFYNTFKELYE